ncbi:MAG: hypothetical protein ABIJ39_11730 [Chloroflexota bacterium]
MIEIGKILKRAWHILWNYKVLWIFGILLAITAGSGGRGSSNARASYNNGNWDRTRVPQAGPYLDEVNQWFEANVEPLFATEAQVTTTVIWIIVGLTMFFILVGVVMALIRYPAETAVIRMVDDYEQTGTKVGFKQGWKLGWTRAAFRIWWIDFLTQILPSILFLLLVGGIGALVYFSVEGGSEAAAVTSIVTAIGCLFLFIFIFALGMTFLGLLRQFFWRVVALENTGTREAFRRGWQMFKGNWQSAGLMWLVMLGLGIGFAIASIFIVLLLIPAFIITALAGLLVSAIPGLIIVGIVSLFASGPLPWIIAVILILPLFFVITGSPMLLITGWAQLYGSIIWTLTYREMKALELTASDEISLPAE